MLYLGPEERASLRYVADRSFFDFVKIVGSYVDHGGDISPNLHLPLCQLAQNKNVRRKLILMPRGWRKSTVYTKWRAIWEYLQDNEKCILIVSEIADRACEFLKWIEEQLQRNELLRYLYPELLAIDNKWINGNTWNSKKAVCPRKGTPADPTFSAIGATSAAQGGHYDLILLDDITGEKAMRSPLILQRALNWFSNCQELLINQDSSSPSASEISGVGTHWAPGDWASSVMTDYPDWQVRITPCRKDASVKDEYNVKWVQNPTQDPGETNFPEAMDKEGNQSFPTDMYVRMESDPDPQKQAVYYSQHMNQPGKSTGLTALDDKWFRFYRFSKDDDGRRVMECETDTGAVSDRVMLTDVPLYGMIDPGGFAEKLVKGGSRLVVLVGGQERGGLKKFVAYTWAGRFKEPMPFIDIVFNAHAEFHPRSWRIDTTGGATYILRDLQAQAKARGIRDFHLSELPTDPTKNSKDDSILALAEPMTAGEVYIQRTMRELIAEAKSYPNSLTKDLLDMMGQLIKCGYWSRRKKTVFDKLFGSPSVDDGRGRSAVTGY